MYRKMVTLQDGGLVAVLTDYLGRNGPNFDSDIKAVVLRAEVGFR